MKKRQGFVQRSVVLAALLALLGTSAAWGSWGYHAPLTFSGYGASETLTNFPALVVLSNNCFGGAYAFSYGQLQSGSNDLAFTDSNGTNLNYEIDTWNPNGVSYIWVQVPALTNNAGITAWWGAAGQSAPACTTNGSVWSGNGYAAVWHMGQTNALDSTANLRNCTSHGTTNATGWIGGAQGFNGSSSFLLSPVNLAGYGVTTNFTVSCWFRSNGGSLQNLMEDGDDYNSDALYLFCYAPSANQMAALVRGVGGFKNNDTISVPTMGTGWHFVVEKYDGVNVELLYDGISVWKSAAALGAVHAGSEHLHFGCRYWNSYLSGAMDEVRVANVTQSSNWTWACYQNMASNAVFQSYGTVAAAVAGLPAVQNVAATNVTQTSAFPNGLLTTNGTSTASVTLYWGPTDGTNNVTAWSNSFSFGANTQPTPTSYTTNLTGLTSGTTYYYRYYAANDAGGFWAAPSLSFTTLALPVVGNGSGATNVASSVATLTGAVAAGNPAPSVYVCWGQADGGTTSTGDWQHVVARGVQSGAFSTSLSGLIPDTTYYYRCFATNSQGAAWSATAASFTTINWTLTGTTLSDGNWSLTVSVSGGNYTITVCTAGSGDLDLRHTGYTITGIGGFSGDTTITSLELPATLTTIGYQAFFNCTSLASVTPLLPGGVVSIGDRAFSYCPFAGDLVITNAGPVTWNGGNFQFFQTKITSATLGTGVTTLPNDMFYNCTNLVSVSLPANLTTIGSEAFRLCTSLGALSLPANLQTIGDNAFYDCLALTNMAPLLPGGVTNIGTCAFAYCPLAGALVITNAGPVTLSGNCQFYGTGISSATLGTGVTNLPYRIFYDCTNLVSVSLPANLTTIGDEAFHLCTALTNVVPLLPGGVTALGNQVFVGYPLAGDLAIANASPVTLSGNNQFFQTKIASAMLGKGVTNIPLDMFYGCTNLQRVSFWGYPTFGSAVFFGATNYQMRMYIPRGNTNWAAFAATGVVALTSIETNRFHANYPGEALPLGTWVPSGAGTEWYCLWSPPNKNATVMLFY